MDVGSEVSPAQQCHSTKAIVELALIDLMLWLGCSSYGEKDLGIRD